MTLPKARLAALFPVQDRHKQLIHLGLLIAWALIQVALGNKFYAVFIVAFFLILAKPHRLNFMLVAVSVLIIVLYTPIPDTVAELKQQNLNTVQNYKSALFHAFSPNSGQEALPAIVQQMLSLLKSNDVTSYQLSKQLSENGLIMQRIVESAWPIKMDSTSPYHLSLLEEINNDSACVVINHRKAVVLAYCH